MLCKIKPIVTLNEKDNKTLMFAAKELKKYLEMTSDAEVSVIPAMEPDFCDDYKERWIRDNLISVQDKPERFELASFYRLVRDPEYVRFLKENGVEKVQLTFFGLEEMTDAYVGRKNAFQELLQATDILIANGISPRWQAFINEENKQTRHRNG